eukprot:Pgem_evm1s5555
MERKLVSFGEKLAVMLNNNNNNSTKGTFNNNNNNDDNSFFNTNNELEIYKRYGLLKQDIKEIEEIIESTQCILRKKPRKLSNDNNNNKLGLEPKVYQYIEDNFKGHNRTNVEPIKMNADFNLEGLENSCLPNKTGFNLIIIGMPGS